MTRYQLMTKAVGAPPADAPTPNNPAMLRQGGTDMDPGRAWAGDLYSEGNVTSPDAAYAHFTLPDGTEGWLDRGVDGSLVGWIRDGGDIYRYSDADAWALDVDGAQMERLDNTGPEAVTDADADESGEAPVEGGETAQEGTELPAGAENPAPAAPVSTDPAAPNNLHPETPAGEAFEKEPDPAGEVVDPAAEAVTDPEHLPEPTGPGEYDNPFEDLDGEDPTEDPSLNEGDVAGDQPETPAEPPKEQPAKPADDPDTDPEDEDAATEDPKSSTKGDPEDGDDPFHKKNKGKSKKLFKGKVQMKHLPGAHDQSDHGNWSDPGHVKPDDAGTSDSGADPKSLTAEQVRRLSTTQLNEIVKPSSDYTEKTKLAASAEIATRRGKSRTGRQ